jgi:hypothetical protein
LAEERPPRKELVEGVLAMHGVPTAQAVLSLEVGGSDDAASDDPLRKTWRIGLERLHGRVAYLVAH